MKTKLFKVKEGKLKVLKEWFNTLSTTFHKEAIESLREEKVTYEATYFFQVGNDWYLLAMTEGELLPSTDSLLNRKHRELMKECVEPVSKGEAGYSFSA